MPTAPQPRADYPPPRSVRALRGLGPALEDTFGFMDARPTVARFIENAALETEAEPDQAAALADAYTQGMENYEQTILDVEAVIGPTRVNAIMHQARNRTAGAFAATAAELLDETWQTALGVLGNLNVSASALGSFPGLVARALPFVQSAFAVYEWASSILQEQYYEDLEWYGHGFLWAVVDSPFNVAIMHAINDRLNVQDEGGRGSAATNIYNGTYDYLRAYYQPFFDQTVTNMVNCQRAWDDSWPSLDPREWGWGDPDASGCIDDMLANIDMDAWVDSIARVVSALLGGEAMARPEIEPTGGMIGERRERHHAAMAAERAAAEQRQSPAIGDAMLRNAVAEAMTLRTHTGHMTIQPGDLRNALAPGNVNGRVVPPQRVRARRGDDWRRVHTTVFGIGVEPDYANITVEPGDVINLAVRTRIIGSDLVIDLKKRSRYGAGWQRAGTTSLPNRPPRSAAAYPASHYDWASYRQGPRPGGGVAGAEFANEAVPEAVRRQAEEYAPGPVDVAAVEERLAYQGRRLAPSRPRRRQTGFQGGFQPRVQPQAAAAVVDQGRDRGPGAGTGEESAQQEENAQGPAVAPAGMGAGALLGIGLAIALTR